MQTKAIIVDLDGTLADNDHRQRLYHTYPRDWDAINHASKFDRPHEWCIEIVRLFAMNNYKIIFLTGRAEESRGVTEEWLMRHIGPAVDYSLLMRADGDKREDTDVKSEIYLAKIAPFFDVLFCIDDRRPVVDMWRDMGLPCLACADNS